MKEKRKSIFKKCGVVALACLGAFSFAGCDVTSNVHDEDLNQRIEQLLQAQEKTNENLEILIENQQVKDNAWALYQKSISNLMLNKDGIRDNMTMTNSYVTENVEFVNKYSFYKVDEDDVMMLESSYTDGSVGGSGTEMFYESEGKMFKSRASGLGFEKSTEIPTSHNMDKFLYNEDIMGEFNEGVGFRFLDLYSKKQNISSVTVLENGNYSIEFVYNNLEGSEAEDYIITMVYVAEISKDGKIYSQSVQYFNVSEMSSSIGLSTVTYGYGDVNEGLIKTNLNKAKSAE